MDYDLYKVDSLDEILGNEHSVSKMREFCRDVNKGAKRTPLLIFGPAGIGKTAAVHLLAKEFGWNVVELNASDYRDSESIEQRLLSAATSRTLFGGRNLILLDEIDETAARFDKGAASAIGNLINQAKNPIIFIANDMWDQSITFLRGKVDPIEFKKIMPDTTQRILTNLCRRLSLSANKTAIEMIAHRANGDARGAINDMSVIIGASDDDEITEVIGLRDRKIDVFNVLDKIFLTNTVSASLRAITTTDLTNDMLIKWVDENVPKRYRYSEEMKAAFDSLALASMFSTRALRSQYYTYWRYMNVLMSSGVALSKTHYPDSARGYSFPKVIKDLSGSKASRNQEKIIAKKLQRVFHSSIRKIINGEMKMLSSTIKQMIKESNDSEDEIRDYLMTTYLLEGKEIDYMLGMAG
jgi:replication factor C large subunit